MAIKTSNFDYSNPGATAKQKVKEGAKQFLSTDQIPFQGLNVQNESIDFSMIESLMNVCYSDMGIQAPYAPYKKLVIAIQGGQPIQNFCPIKVQVSRNLLIGFVKLVPFLVVVKKFEEPKHNLFYKTLITQKRNAKNSKSIHFLLLKVIFF